MQSVEEEASGASVSEQLLMNTERVGILLVSTLNTNNNETVKQIKNQNIGMLVAYLYYIQNVFIVCTYINILPYNKSSRLMYACTYLSQSTH